jgi:hypothetical protein
LKFTSLKNVKVYISSYFRINDDRPAKSFYFIDDEDLLQLPELDFTIEMYNKTFVYIVPKDTSPEAEDPRAEFKFWVF